MADAVVILADNRATAQPFGAELLAPLLKTSTDAASVASAAATKLAGFQAALSSTVAILIGRPVDPVQGGSVTGGGTFVFADAVTTSDTLAALKVYVAAPGTFTIGRYSLAAGTLTRVAEYTAVATGTGLRTFTPVDFGVVPLNPGEMLSIEGAGLFTYDNNVAGDGAGFYSLPAGTPAAAPAGNAATQVRIQAQFVTSKATLAVTAAAFQTAQAQAAASATAAAALVENVGLIGRPADPVNGSAVTAHGLMWADPAPSGAVALATLKLFVAAKGTLTIARYTVAAGKATLVAAYPVQLTATGLQTLDAATLGTIPLRAGEYLYLVGPALFTFTNATPADGAGWYDVAAGGVPAAITLGAPVTTVRLEAQFVIAVQTVTAAGVRQSQAALASYDDRIVAATASVSAFTTTVAGTFSRGGAQSPIGGSVTVQAAANVRYDVLWYDTEAGTLGITTGTDRASDAAEFIPGQSALPVSAFPAVAAPPSTAIPLYNLRVTSAGLSCVPVWGVYDGEQRGLALNLRQDRERAARRLRRVRGRIERLAPLRILSFGDSIVAIQNTAAGSAGAVEGSPNGVGRDRAAAAAGDASHYLRDNIGADVVDNAATVPLYTAAQLGRADDGAGQVHTRIGFVWEMVRDLERAGYQLGTSLFYDNFGCAGYATTNAWANGAPTAWLNAATAYVAANAVNLVVLNLGQNEYGSANTRANLAGIIAAFQAAGAEVVVMGVVRQRTAAGWDYTSRAIRGAAEAAGAAHVALEPLYLDTAIGAIGMAPADRSNANRINHPGLAEHRAIGRTLARVVLP